VSMPGPAVEKRPNEPSATRSRTGAACKSDRTNPAIGKPGKLYRQVVAGASGRPGIRKTAERTQRQSRENPTRLGDPHRGPTGLTAERVEIEPRVSPRRPQRPQRWGQSQESGSGGSGGRKPDALSGFSACSSAVSAVSAVNPSPPSRQSQESGSGGSGGRKPDALPVVSSACCSAVSAVSAVNPSPPSRRCDGWSKRW